VSGDGLVIVRADLWPSRGDWEGIVASVNVSPGDRVRVGDVLVEVEVEKAVVEIESPVDGVVAEVYVSRGDRVNRGTPLVAIRPEGASGG